MLLPLECFTPGAPNGGNTCGTGSIGVADPATLAFRYYVKLDPAEIAKAMWVESSPDGRLLWTSSGRDLLAYRAADVTAARRRAGGRSAPRCPPARGAVPPSGVTGAAFVRGRLLFAGARGTTYQVWSVDTRSGTRRLELELPRVQGEAEGLHAMRLMNGELHWLIAPLAVKPTFPPSVALLHFTARAGGRAEAEGARHGRTTKRPRISIRVPRRGRPVAGAVVTLADAGRRTDRGGRVTLMPRLAVPGQLRGGRAQERPARDDEALPALGPPRYLRYPISSRWRTFARSSACSLGGVSNQPSRISPSTASLVVRSERASTLASFQVRAPRAVSASAQSAARIPATLLAAIEAPVPVQQQTIALLRPALRHVARGGLARPGPVIALLVAERAVHERLVPAPPQLVDDGLGHPRALVGGH